MVSLMKNVVHWGSQSSRVKTPPVQIVIEMCEVRTIRLWDFVNLDLISLGPKICGKKPKFVENGHKHPYCSRSCARNGAGPTPTACVLHGCRATGKPAFANFCSEAHARYATSMSACALIRKSHPFFIIREGVRQGQVDGCELCEVQPRIAGTMCIPCDRLVRAGPRLRELGPDSKVFKNCEWTSC